MKLNRDTLDEFKEFMVQSSNDDIYYQLKDWISNYDYDASENAVDDFNADDHFNEIVDYFMDNLHGSLQWVETESYRPHTK